VGESEKNMDEVLKTIDGMGECIVVVDEIDKALAGFGSGGSADGGVSERVFGKLPTWLQDWDTKAFVIATANDISHLPASLFRSSRWNATLFVDYDLKRQNAPH
jgi:SpoVK/Ycf46/Vps4 family AAA+-type ATPase